MTELLLRKHVPSVFTDEDTGATQRSQQSRDYEDSFDTLCKEVMCKRHRLNSDGQANGTPSVGYNARYVPSSYNEGAYPVQENCSEDAEGNAVTNVKLEQLLQELKDMPKSDCRDNQMEVSMLLAISEQALQNSRIGQVE